MASDRIIFTDAPNGITAKKLNLIIAQLLASSGGGTSTGDMLKSVYDTNNNGKVDTADAIPWGSVTGKPTVFPPDSTAMLKSVYDTNNDGISDHAAVADTAPWTGITGKPATFPPDSTAMLKSVYDTNSNNVVDTCDSLAWSKLTGVPATFPPDSSAMLKSVYDTNANNKVDAAESADSVAWTGITGKPASFAPSAHATTHLDNGSDPISVVTTSRMGLAPVLSGNAATYLNGTGVFSAPSGSGDMLKSIYDTNGNNVVDTCDSLNWSKLTGVPVFVPTGSMFDFAGSTAPSGFVLCDGTSYATTGTYAALFAVIGYTYGGSGSTFNVPDCRSRTIVGAGQGTGLTNRVLAASGGEETHQLTIGELAPHSHNYDYINLAGSNVGQTSPTLGYSVNGHATTTTGSGTAHNNMQPFIALNKIIKI